MTEPTIAETLFTVFLIVGVICLILIPLAWASDKFDEWLENRDS